MPYSEADLTVLDVWNRFSEAEKELLYKLVGGCYPIKVNELQLYYHMSPTKLKVFNYILTEANKRGS